MNRARHISGKSCFRVSTSRSGTVLMECVLVLPLLTLLIFSIVQFALIWYAQIMTHYAAYNAARAALVYHPGEYRKVDEKGNVSQTFQMNSGVCWEAACRTLAWVSNSPSWDSDRLGGLGTGFAVPGWWPTGGGKYSPIPSSSHTENQVRIVNDLDWTVEMTNAPVVKVTVAFDYPLHVPVIGRMIAYLEHIEDAHPSEWSVTGWTPTADGIAVLDSLHHPTMDVDYVTLISTVMVPKPWKSTHYARRP